MGALGALDDYLNARTGDGIRGRHKVIWQTVVALIAAFNIQRTYHITALAVPFIGAVDIPAWAYIVFAAFAIVATCNGVNLTDGLDGLAGGTLIFAFIAYLIIALLNAPLAQPNLAVLSALIIGALLGFLWFNVHPAQVFMGDSGSLSLGATLAVTALITGQVLILPLIGVIFVVEAGSDIIQVGYFKLTGGERIFRMAPLHHHFELGGWDEEKVTLRFWIVGVLAGDARRGLLPGHRGQAAVTAMTIDRPGPGTAPLDLARLDLDSFAGRPVAVLGLARSGVALARFLADRGAQVTVYDQRPRHELEAPIVSLEGRAVQLPAGPGRGPGGGPARPGADRHLARRQQPLPHDRAAPAGAPWPTVEAAGRRARS